MTPHALLEQAIRPALVQILSIGGPAPSPLVQRLLLAIALQESGLTHRAQVLANGHAGKARGFWQFEQVGVAGVMEHSRSTDLASALCRGCTVEPHPGAVWRAIEGHDVLAAGIARLLIWTDRAPLPATAGEAWACYERLWRPGKPRPDAWPDAWRVASAEVGA